MKIICEKNDLINAINISSKAVSQKSPLSILECILFECNNSNIKLISNNNNNEIGIETILDGDIIEKGSIALKASILGEIIRKLPDGGNVTISSDSNYKTSINCENVNINIIGRSGDDFTYLPIIDRNNEIVLSQYSLKEVVRQTIFSINENDSNKIMGGELFEINENILKIMSLDGHRTSIRYLKLRDVYEDRKIIIPGRTLNEVSKLMSIEEGADLIIYNSDKHVVFEFDNTRVVMRLMDGKFFNIDEIISGDYESKISINRRSLINCLERASLLIKDGEKKPIIITVKDSNMNIKINTQVGSMKENIDINKEGKDIMIGFNPKFILDALKAIDDDEVVLYMINAKAPCLIKDNDKTFIYMILPVNFQVSVVD